MGHWSYRRSMKKRKIIVFFLMLHILLPKYIELTVKDIERKKYLFDKHKWLDDKLYNLYKYRSWEYTVPMELACCLVQRESGGRNKVSKKNRNLGLLLSEYTRKIIS